MPPPVWPPDSILAQKSQLSHFISATGLADFPTLLQRSKDDPTWVVHQMITFLRLRFDSPFHHVTTTKGIYCNDWIKDGTVNASRLITENAPASQIALTWENEQGESRSWSYRAFAAVTRRAAATLVECGVGIGDKVVIPKNLTLETIAALSACARIGAIGVESTDSDFIIDSAPWDSLDKQPLNQPPLPLPPETLLLDHRTHGAFIIKAAIDLAFVAGVGRGTRFAWFGKDPWMLLGALALGATVVLFDPKAIVNPDRLWALCAHQNIEVIGLTPQMAVDLPSLPSDRHNLDRLEIILIDGVLYDPAFTRLHKLTGAGHLSVLQYLDGVQADNLLCPVEAGIISQYCLGSATSC